MRIPLLRPNSICALICLCAIFSWCGACPELAAAIPSPGFSRTIYLVRHGAYDTGEKDEQNVGGLTPLGVAQARLVGARLRGMPVTFTSLTASTMARAQQSAMVIRESLSQLTLQTTPLLRECTPSTWREDVMKEEKLADLAAAEAQLNEAFAKYFVPAKDRDEHDILVCHGNVIRWFICKALSVDTSAWLGMSVAHCSLTIIQVTPSGAFRVLSVGDVGHIPPNLQSGATRAVEPQLVAP